MEETPQRVLVVTPHPDDAEIWCGGTLAIWIQDGAEVHYLLCTDGGRGTERPGVTSQALSAMREQEQLDSARILGVKDVVMLHRPDGELEDTGDFRKDIVRQIRKVRPEVVLVTEPYRINMSWHRDHRIAGQVALDAVFPYARDHLHFGELWAEEGLEPYKTGAMLFWGTERPDTVVDISRALEQKIAAVQAHRSQMEGYSEAEVVEFVKERAREAGAANGHQYAEAFRKVTFRT
jgi:LmbE family N-acetylglucosaminyl deacetylase